MDEWAEALDVAWPSSGPNGCKEISIAVGASPKITLATPMAEIGALVDAVDLMTYDCARRTCARY